MAPPPPPQCSYCSRHRLSGRRSYLHPQFTAQLVGACSYWHLGTEHVFLWPCAYYYYFLRLKFLTTKFLTGDAVCTKCREYTGKTKNKIPTKAEAEETKKRQNTKDNETHNNRRRVFAKKEPTPVWSITKQDRNQTHLYYLYNMWFQKSEQKAERDLKPTNSHEFERSQHYR